MAKIAVIGCGNTGQILCETLQGKIPEADFVVVNHFKKDETSTVATKLNTRLKRKLTDDELSKYASEISKLKHYVQPGDSYWWYRSKQGYRYPGYMDLVDCGIALVRDQDIVETVSNGFPGQMAGVLDGYPESLRKCLY